MRVLGQLTLDLVGIAGLGSVVYGVSLIYVPAAWIAGGLFVFLGIAAITRKANR